MSLILHCTESLNSRFPKTNALKYLCKSHKYINFEVNNNNVNILINILTRYIDA